MLCPHGAHFFVRRELAAQNLGVSFGEVGVFFRGQLDRWLIHTGELQQDAGKFVLHVVGKDGDRFNGLFKQSRHACNIEVMVPSIYGFPIAIAIAAATNGNGSDTAARNQTKRAGMNGISHRISRWNANSAQAMT
jgi:hypothetical protein